MTDPQNKQALRTARLYDLRSAIAALFTIFGILVSATGLFASDEDLTKSEGVNLSLWTGLGMLALAAVFWLWMFMVPPDIPTGHEASEFEPPSTSD